MRPYSELISAPKIRMKEERYAHDSKPIIEATDPYTKSYVAKADKYQIGREHVGSTVTGESRMASSA